MIFFFGAGFALSMLAAGGPGLLYGSALFVCVVVALGLSYCAAVGRRSIAVQIVAGLSDIFWFS